MKKLMIAAAAAAMIGGAYAGADSSFAGVYNLKYTLKTIAPKTFQCGEEVCTICVEQYKSTGFYYENGTVKLEGVIAYCDPCEEVGEDYVGARLALWDAVNKEPIYVDYTWDNATLVTDVDAKRAAVSNVFSKIDAVVYGKSSTKVAVDTKINYTKLYTKCLLAGIEPLGGEDFVWDLRAAGLGSYAWTKNGDGYIKSVSGSVAGTIPAFTGYYKPAKVSSYGTYWSGLVVDDTCKGVATYCGTRINAVVPQWEKDYVVPAYGTWTMKYNSAATKKPLKESIPSAVRAKLD